MAVLIDASVLIDFERGRIDLGDHVRNRGEAEFFLSVITVSELLRGVHRAADRVTRARRSAFVEALLSEFPVLPADILTARTHSRLWADLAARGEPIGAHDLWLAATCVGHGMSLATGNRREFERIEGLRVEVWTAG